MTQDELDRIKWEKSVNLGIDACGTFDFCCKCDKYQPEPCIKAFNKYNGVEEKTIVVEMQPAQVEAVAPKTPSKSAAKTTAKKAPAKKSPAKKSTTKTTSKTATKKTTKK